jgi:hypothetical protein
MITKEDLIGEWTIIKNVLKDPSDGKQEQIDKINKAYVLEFKENGTYREKNNGILFTRLSNFSGKFFLKGNDLKLTIKAFKHGRTYTILSFEKENSTMTVRPCDTLYCGIYTNIDYLIMQKKVEK